MAKALGQHNQDIHPHPLGVHHPNNYWSLGGRRARDTNRSIRSCRKHQMSKLFIVPDIVPDIVFFIRYRRNEPSVSKDGIRYRRKDLRYWARYSKFACLCHLISGPISKVFLRYRRNDLRLRYRRFYTSLPPDIKGLYSISVAISNISRAISSIYQYWAPLSNHFY
jgi:hypothetical protein